MKFDSMLNKHKKNTPIINVYNNMFGEKQK